MKIFSLSSNMDIKQVFETYNESETKILEYFNYEQDWHLCPIVFNLNDKWCVIGDNLHTKDEKDEYESTAKEVHRAEDYTMIVEDLHSDGNIFLSIFDNKKEIKELSEQIKEFEEIDDGF